MRTHRLCQIISPTRNHHSFSIKLATITTALFSIGALAAPSPTPQLEAFQFAPLQWSVVTSPGHTVTFNGTLEALAIQLQNEHVKLQPPATKLSAAHANSHPNPSPDTNTDAAAITRRTVDFSGGTYFCGGPWPYTHMAAYWEGLRYLRSITGAVRVPPGPRMCSRVSCSYGAAVWICNDRTDELYLDAFARIADGVSYIIGRCATNNWGTTQVAGQVFHPDHWNVIVRHDDC